MIEKDITHETQSVTSETAGHESRIRDLMLDAEIPEGIFSETDIQIGVGLLNKSKAAQEGSDQLHSRPYHDIDHDFSVLRRCWGIWSEFQRRMPDKFDDQGYRTLLFGSLGHDWFVYRDTAEGKDEKRSGKATMRYMISSGCDRAESTNVNDVIQGTATRFNEGSVVQYNLTSGIRSPEKFTLGIADTYGILIEGPSVMIENALNLHMETTGSSIKDLLYNPKRAVGMMLSQDSFIQDRLDSLKPAVDYNFATEEERVMVEDVLTNLFFSGGSEAISLAARMKAAPDLAEKVICNALNVTGQGSRKVTALKNKLGKIIP